MNSKWWIPWKCCHIGCYQQTYNIELKMIVDNKPWIPTTLQRVILSKQLIDNVVSPRPGFLWTNPTSVTQGSLPIKMDMENNTKTMKWIRLSACGQSRHILKKTIKQRWKIHQFPRLYYIPMESRFSVTPIKHSISSLNSTVPSLENWCALVTNAQLV